MEFGTKRLDLIFELNVKSGNANITEDLAIHKDGKYIVEKRQIESFIMVARECSGFNGNSDVDFVESIIKLLLIDSEKSELMDRISNELENSNP